MTSSMPGKIPKRGRMARRRFGTIFTQSSPDGRAWIEARYSPKPELAERYPRLPKRIVRHFPEGFEVEAEQWLAREETLMRLGEWTPPETRKKKRKAQSQTFHDYATAWIENRRRASGEPLQETTKQKYREYLENHLDEAFGRKTVIAITYRDIVKWCDSFPAGKRGAVVRKQAYTLLKAILATAASEPLDDTGTTLIDRNPAMLKTSSPKSHRDVPIAELDELRALRLAMPKGLELAIPLAGVMGLREGEVCGLQRRDIDMKARRLHVRHSVKPIYDADGHRTLVLGSTKTVSSVRDLDIPLFLLPLIRDHLAMYTSEEPEAMVFTGRKSHGMVAPQSLRNAWNRAKAIVPRLEHMRFHDLRHTALTRLAEMGATGGELMEQAGHTSLKIASIYQQSSDKHREQVMQRLDDAIGQQHNHEEPAEAATNLVDELARLGDLHSRGVLDDAEFKAAKARLLS